MPNGLSRHDIARFFYSAGLGFDLLAVGMDLPAGGIVIIGGGAGGILATAAGGNPAAVVAGIWGGAVKGESIGSPFRNMSSLASVAGTTFTAIGDLVAGETQPIPGGIQIGAATVDSVTATALGMFPESIFSLFVSTAHFYFNDIVGPSIPCTRPVSFTCLGISGCR